MLLRPYRRVGFVRMGLIALCFLLIVGSFFNVHPGQNPSSQPAVVYMIPVKKVAQGSGESISSPLLKSLLQEFSGRAQGIALYDTQGMRWYVVPTHDLKTLDVYLDALRYISLDSSLILTPDFQKVQQTLSQRYQVLLFTDQGVESSAAPLFLLGDGLSHSFLSYSLLLLFCLL